MLVLFMGSLGGFMAGGILGLFVGAVVLSIGYTVFIAWLDHSGDESESISSGGAAPESSQESP
jgi:predicted PurR-regulated permease PerM